MAKPDRTPGQVAYAAYTKALRANAVEVNKWEHQMAHQQAAWDAAGEAVLKHYEGTD